MQQLYESTSSLSAACAGYQQRALEIVQSLTMARFQQTCLSFSTNQTIEGCDEHSAIACINDLAHFLTPYHVSDEIACGYVYITERNIMRIKRTL